MAALLILIQLQARAEGEPEERVAAGMGFVRLPAGCFQMGSPADESGRDEDEGPLHEVCLDGFWMQRREVTQGEWLRLAGRNPAHFALSEHHPVEQVSWEDVQGFIRKLNTLGEGSFRLPTEAEWEYAARAGRQTPYAFGATLDAGTQANFNGRQGQDEKGLFRQSTTPAGSFPPNAWGVHDMHGNVSEWVADWYCEGFYRWLKPGHKNPLCQDDASGFRLLRGGSWYDHAPHLRAADRGWSTPENRHATIGFRLVWSEGKKELP
ncbi:MAG: formylglycine-generating enzyme family protein [Magnetococcales bacterium]|nr:formylglycine-generating enzyme family protein [Magnetococcales bacterium]